MPTTQEDIVRAASSLGVIAGGANTAHRILATLCDPSLDARQIAEVIQREPALAARVLKVANSAFYGSSRNVGTLDRALMLLGLDSVRGIAAAACLDRSVARRSQQAPIDPRALALHSVASAFAAEALTKQCGRAIPTEAFMAALLHDFGVPVQERVDSAGVRKLLDAIAKDPEAQIAVLEAQLVQVTHGHCAEVVFENWRLPQSIVVAAKHHDDPSQAPGPARDLTTLVHLGVQLALEAGFTHPLEPRQLRIPREPLLKAVGLEEDSFASITESLAERVLLMVESG
jgi:HD-like signal output (HDOD) protein